MPHLKRILQRIRASQPCNWMITSTAQMILHTTGLEMECLSDTCPNRYSEVQTAERTGPAPMVGAYEDITNEIYWRGWTGYEPETVQLFFRLAQQARTRLTSVLMSASSRSLPRSRTQLVECTPSSPCLSSTTC